ncbi:hypothetical protein [Streptomyces botrytidirepellens]|uniref:Uncharacterized protein n=1 Tax=Streptomyces botrytidirepellens TaxID=2486417 RepID=A0A3M8WK18_9ACTN|nr:hypothetical protein [Streptomyces botrytidirepellens]RNG28303.1 hypothetical protein EEJ42_12280 [Streptomyces botrytidirepellens]
MNELQDLIDDYECVYQGYYLGDDEEIDAVVTACVDRLEEARGAHGTDSGSGSGSGSGSADVAFPALGLVLMYGHVMHHSAPEVADRTATALRAVAADGAQAPCDHAGHPSDEGLVFGQLEGFPTALELIGDPATEDVSWDELAIRSCGADSAELSPAEAESRWRCPRSLAGFASAAAEAIRPTRPADV